jgi:NADH:ubiquinone oxidoreductase subunit 3 (subunit A)
MVFMPFTFSCSTGSDSQLHISPPPAAVATSYQHMLILFAVSAKVYVVVSCRKSYYTSSQGRWEKANPPNSKNRRYDYSFKYYFFALFFVACQLILQSGS